MVELITLGHCPNYVVVATDLISIKNAVAEGSHLGNLLERLSRGRESILAADLLPFGLTAPFSQCLVGLEAAKPVHDFFNTIQTYAKSYSTRYALLQQFSINEDQETDSFDLRATVGLYYPK